MCFFVSKGLGRRRITALKRRYPEKICINQIKSLTLQRKKNDASFGVFAILNKYYVRAIITGSE